MQRYIKTPEIQHVLHSITIGCNEKRFCHPLLLTPRGLAKNKDGQEVLHPKGYPLMYELIGGAVQEEPVHKWTSSSTCMDDLLPGERTVANKIKFFINLPEIRTLVIFHDKDGVCNQQCYGDHYHVITRSTVAMMTKFPEYRACNRQVSNAGGYMTCHKIKGSADKFLNYLQEDPEKIFLGTNCKIMLGMFNAVLTDTQSKLTWSRAEEDVDGGILTKQWDNVKWHGKDGMALSISSSSSSNAALASGGINKENCTPDHLMSEKPAQTIAYLYKELKKHPGARSVTQLMTKYAEDSQEWKTICQIGTSSTNRTSFDMALAKLDAEMAQKTPYEIIEEMDPTLHNYMLPMHSLALYNSWCAEQNIKPRYLYCIFVQLLSGLGKKRIGMYFQGAGNSGKTMLTNSCFNCIPSVVGNIVKDNFPLQSCGGKKIIIGEEVAFTTANLETYKDLMSGAKVQCAKKCTTPTECTPSIVLINSNMKYNSNLDSRSAAIIALRLFIFDDLKPSAVLKDAYDFFHPQLFCLGAPPTCLELAAIAKNQVDFFDDSPVKAAGHGLAYSFNGDWDDIPDVYDPISAAESEIFGTEENTCPDEQDCRIAGTIDSIRPRASSPSAADPGPSPSKHTRLA